jgi:hypothetical protein
MKSACKILKPTLIFCLAWALATACSGSPRPAAPASVESPAAQAGGAAEGEQIIWQTFLKKAKVVSVTREVLGGRTRPWIVLLDDGKMKKRALFKHIDVQRPRPAPDSFRYELAAYELTKLLRVEIVPPLVEREVQGTKGSLQIYLENCISERERMRKKIEPPDAAAHARALEGLKVFECLVYDECGDLDDSWVHLQDWRVCRVDFSEAFFPSAEFPKSCVISVCPRKLYEGLLQLEDGVIGVSLMKYLNKDEMASLLVRKNLIIERIKGLIAEKGEEAVLF